jgi:hypothetical protein
MSKLPVHLLENATRNKSSERIATDASTVEKRHSQAKLLPCVPFRKKEHGTREEGGFDESQEKARKQGTSEASTSISAVKAGARK